MRRAVAGWLLGILLATPAIIALVVVTSEPAGTPAPTWTRTEVRHLCAALDEAGSDSTDPVVLDACRRALPG